MRGREFIMKDAYSFDQDEDGARLSYQKMYDAYQRIFSRCGLTFRAVEADTGLIGGTSSHEFMVLAETGEETIVYAESGPYAANVERAEVLPPSAESTEEPRPLKKVPTPGVRTVEEVAAFLKAKPEQIVKTLLYKTPTDTVAVLVRGDHEANEIKIKKVLNQTDIELADSDTVTKVSGAPVGFAGPIGLRQVRILADHAVRAMRNLIVGGNAADTHYVDVHCGRDFSVDAFADLRNARAGDASPKGGGLLCTAKGIEVGHVFMLGTKYSEAMGAKFLDAAGQERPAVMGCYGIGVGRTAAAAIEQNYDAKGIIWPAPIAPFDVHLLPLSQSAKVEETVRSLYEQLADAGIEALWDDRDERAGVKFNDADLIGIPYQVVIGEKGLAKGSVELKERKTGQVTALSPQELPSHLAHLLRPQERASDSPAGRV
jgi:prolyl-tRNA synthetase